MFIPLYTLMCFIVRAFSNNRRATKAMTASHVGVRLPRTGTRRTKSGVCRVSEHFNSRSTFATMDNVKRRRRGGRRLRRNCDRRRLGHLSTTRTRERQRRERLSRLRHSLTRSEGRVGTCTCNGNPSKGDRANCKNVNCSSRSRFTHSLRRVRQEDCRQRGTVRDKLNVGGPRTRRTREGRETSSVTGMHRRRERHGHPDLMVGSSNAGTSEFGAIATPSRFTRGGLVHTVVSRAAGTRRNAHLQFGLLSSIAMDNAGLGGKACLCKAMANFKRRHIETSVADVLINSEFVGIGLSMFSGSNVRNFCIPRSTFHSFVGSTNSGAMRRGVDFRSDSNCNANVSARTVTLRSLRGVCGSTASTVSSGVEGGGTGVGCGAVICLVGSRSTH